MDHVPAASGRVCFVLARPGHPGNIGAAARAVKTMGFSDLRVAAPLEPGYRDHPEAVAYATSSVDVLRCSKSFPSLSEALRGVSLAFALTGYSRKYGPPFSDLRSGCELARSFLGQGGGRTVAFVFGTERSGLTNGEIDLCQRCLAIPANPESPSLNLAQSVQVSAYEMHLALLGEEKAGELYSWQERFGAGEPAGPQAMEGLYGHWEEAMVSCGALDPAEPKHLMEMSRRIFSRAGLTQSEVDLLRGICAAVILPRAERAGRKKAAKAAARRAGSPHGGSTT